MTTLLSYTHGASDVPLLGETIGENLRRTVARFGEREALVVRHQGVRLTYQQLWDQTTRAACGLLAHGVQKGDRVGLWAANRFEWVVLQYAAARVGAILVNINPAYRPPELEYALKQSGGEPVGPRPRLPPERLRRDAERRAPRLPRPARGAGLRRRLAPAAGRRRRRFGDRARRARSRGRVRRPGQHPVHLGHDGFAQGGHAHPPQHPQQRLLWW